MRNGCAVFPLFMASLWVFMFVLSRLFMFYSEYQNEVSKIADDEWLRVKCKDPDFFHNMKQHTDLCLKVEQNARKSTMLVALNTVISSTYLCGYRSCGDYITEGVQWVLGFGLPVLVLMAAVVVLFPTLLYPFYVSQLNRMADRRVMSLYNAPYGLPHYMEAQRQPLVYSVIEDAEDIKKIV